MKFSTMTSKAIAQEIGSRIKQARLNANLTQQAVVNKTGLSIKAIINAEKGKSQLETLITILSALELVDQLNLFLPEQEISPLQLAKLKGQKRQRASKTKASSDINDEETSSW
jgi:putative transcriptional regulator